MTRRARSRPPVAAGAPVAVLDHILALLAEMDLRYQQRFDAQNTALDAARLAAKEGVTTALTAAEKAVNKAEIAAEKRFESVNEFRAQLTDQAATFLQRNEYETAHQSVVEKIADLSARLDRTEGAKTGLDSGWKILIAAATLALGIWLAFHR